MSVRKEVSAGGVVYRRTGEAVEIALAARRTRRGELVWGLPKGQIEAGESPEDAADTRYFYVWDTARIRKLVHMYLLRATGGDVGDHDDEMEEVRWFSKEEVVGLAAYRGEREVLQRAVDRLSADPDS